MKYLIAVVFTLISTVSHAEDIPDIESRKIGYLITSIETLENAEFIRNGKAHAAKDAAAHLRLKLKKAGSRVKTAEDFIKYCASVSSVSGEPYQIRFADGQTVTAEAYLRQKLLEFKAGV
jgi:hypothetical protein